MTGESKSHGLVLGTHHEAHNCGICQVKIRRLVPEAQSGQAETTSPEPGWDREGINSIEEIAEIFIG